MDATFLWRIRGYVMLATALTLLVFGAIGYGIDHWVGSWPKAFIGLIFLSFPVSNVVAIRLTKSKLRPPSSY